MNVHRKKAKKPMAITEKYDKNGMIKAEELEHVLILVAMDVDSLSGCYSHLVHYKYEMQAIESTSLKERYDIEDLLEIHAINLNLMKFHKKIFARNAKDLYEFFYQTSGFDKEAYYAVQIPLDRKKFVKKRVKEKIIKNALRNKKKNALKIVEMMYANMDAFLGSLTVKVKKPKFTKIDLEHYKETEEDPEKVRKIIGEQKEG